MSLQVKIKKLHKNAIIPSYAKEGDAAMDITATEVNYDNQYVSYKTGIAIEIPEGFVGLLFPRSSISKKELLLCNSVGVIDSGYRGELEFRFKLVGNGVLASGVRNIYSPGERVGQLMVIPHPYVKFVEVEQLSETSRNDSGFGSTGN
jgi:dUTP pyrophosphatase